MNILYGQVLLITLNYNAIAILHTFQSTVAHALGFSIFTSHLLAMDLNTEISTSNHCEVSCHFVFNHYVLLCPNLYSTNLHNSLRTCSTLVLVLSTALHTNLSYNRSSLYRLLADHTETQVM
jgi:hypothetical protein